jgi:cell division protein FtsQ
MKTKPQAGAPAPLLASLESYGPETAWVGRPSAKGRGPAPAGALRRTYEGFTTEEGAGGDVETPGARGKARAYDDEDEYVPRRGAGSARLSAGRMVRGLTRSTAGRVVLGVGFLLVLGAVAVGLAYARAAVLGDARFTLAAADEIQVVGNQHLTREQAVAVFAADMQRNIFLVPLGKRRADLERLPWVGHATVERLLPNRLRVQIQERVPVAFVRQGTQIGLADAKGVLLDMPEADAGDPQYSFPVLTGIVAADPLSTRAARMGIYLEFMKALDSSHEHLSRNISEVDVSDPEDVRALVTAGDADVLVHFGEGQYLERYRSFEAHLPAWRTQYPKLAAADMRYEGQIVLEMAHGSAADAAPVPAVSAVAPAAPSGSAASLEARPAASAEVARPSAKPAEAARLLSPVGAKMPTTAAIPSGAKASIHAEASTAGHKPRSFKTQAVHPPLKTATVKAVTKPAAVKVAAKSAGKAKPKADGRSAANERLFAELAAARKQSVAAQAKKPAVKAVQR